MNAAATHEEEALLRHVEYRDTVNGYDDPILYELDDWDDVEDTAVQYDVTQSPRWWGSMKQRTTQRRGASEWSFFVIHAPRRRRSWTYRVAQFLVLLPNIIIACVLICGIYFPSYSNPPEHYLELRSRIVERGQSANIHNEKVFIAASLHDQEGELLGGSWGEAVLHLVDILGPDNVFVSIYENDPDEQALAAMDHFAKHLPCDSALVAEHLDVGGMPHLTTFNGNQRLKRISFLADVRNRALRPLEDAGSSASGIRFDKLLYLNDVIFDPIDAANLLFSTNIDKRSGKTQYRAACAMDFINPFKFYDTYATRDLEGYETGVVFYPWFTRAGDKASRNDVMQQKDAVRVKSCWGGMVAFEAKWFQQSLGKKPEPDSASVLSVATGDRVGNHRGTERVMNRAQSTPHFLELLRFRADADTYWDSSECCLIHADLSSLEPSSLAPGETGIYMNPYIRVAYSPNVLPWLAFTRRFERLYTPINTIVNWIAGKPMPNERQFEEPGQEVIDRVWTWDKQSEAALQNGTTRSLHGYFKGVRRIALPGGFCGVRKLVYVNENPTNGEGPWLRDTLPDGL